MLTIHEANFLVSTTIATGLPAPAFVEVAFAGRSNVGKSSLINTLVARRKLVRTSSTPGCTRALNLFRIKVSEAFFDFVDLPGYGFAKRSKSERRSWGTLIEEFLETRSGLRAVVLIIDIRRGLEDDDAQLIEYLEHIGRDVVLVATKLDKLPLSKRKNAVTALSKATGIRVVGFSSETKDGREELWRRLHDLAGVPFPTKATELAATQADAKASDPESPPAKKKVRARTLLKAQAKGKTKSQGKRA